MKYILGNCIVSWSSKKQNSVALSTTEAEYVVAGSGFAQILYIKQQLEDFNLHMSKIPLLCDNISTICLSKNLVHHSRTKHIEIRYHFIRDHVEKGDIEISHETTKLQLADIFTKPLNEERFSFIRCELGMFRLCDLGLSTSLNDICYSCSYEKKNL